MNFFQRPLPVIPSAHSDLTGRDTVNQHPMTAISFTAVTSLPESPINHITYYLSQDDDTVKVPKGYYRYDGSVWRCSDCLDVYNLGDLGATPSLSLTPGVIYQWNISAEITGATIALTGEGIIGFISTNSGGNAWVEKNTTATDRTIKDVEGSAFTNLVETAGCIGTIKDDGTNLWITAAKDA